MPHFVAEGSGIRLLHSPQWWVGKSAAEIRAEPMADEYELSRVKSKIQELEMKRIKKCGRTTVRETEIESKLEEWMRRQEAGEDMFDDGDEEEESEEDLEVVRVV
jgi:hypothetical protein